MPQHLEGNTKEKKRGVGLNFVVLCFSAQEEPPICIQQQPRLHYQPLQPNFDHQIPDHLNLQRPQSHLQITPRSPSQVGSSHGAGRGSPGNLSKRSQSKEDSVGQASPGNLLKGLPSKEELLSSKGELQGQKSPRILYTPKDVKELRQHPEYSNCNQYTFEELKVITKHFRPDLIIGEGGFGVVYRGVIGEAKKLRYKHKVAIKQLNRNGIQGDKEWLTEVSYLGQLSHPNLVKLTGYCCEDEHRLLVYEYMAAGCLEKHLFRRTSATLTWVRRLKILLDAAKGLAYLHGLPQPIIYRDFKTSNVLLDSSFNAKLSDFGLAKEGPTGDQTHVSTRVIGTYGYAAPEYIMTGHLTARSDVYGFGVVLLEMLIGRRALDKSWSSREHDLVEWCHPLLNNKKKLLRILDARIDGQYSVKELMRVANLGYQCLSQNPKGRPLMSQVVEILEAVHEEEAKLELGPRLSLDSGPDLSVRRNRRERRTKSESHNDFPIFSHNPDMRTHTTTSNSRGC